VVPQNHWLLVEDTAPFRAVLNGSAAAPQHVSSIRVGAKHIASFVPGQTAGDARLSLERYVKDYPHIEAAVRFVTLPPIAASQADRLADSLVLLTNGRGGMARLGTDLGRIQSKYDCLLGANLHPGVPVDRHVLAKRVRAWVNADGFISALNLQNLAEFTPGPPARWRFVASAGNDRAVEIVLTADMLDGRNSTVLRFERPEGPVPFGHDLPPDGRVSLTVRIDIEDRSFHSETHHNGGADQHFNAHTRLLPQKVGFEFQPADDRHLCAVSDGGAYHVQPEWSSGIGHPVEASRGQVGHGDAFSPGWFELPLAKGTALTLTVTAEATGPIPDEVTEFVTKRHASNAAAVAAAGLPGDDSFGQQLAVALRAFVVRRDQGKTVIAGYPWFLDWGRDSLIAARGMLAAGMTEEVQQLLQVFGRFEANGTLPNIIHGEDASNRDTSDASLWYGVVCEELAGGGVGSHPLYSTVIDSKERMIVDVLQAIATGYRDGTPNGIRMDPDSALIWSPSHFTWMDTNYPAATPREGYPVEIQVLWIRLLRQLARLGRESNGESWTSLANRAEQSVLKHFWLEDRGYLADLLIARPGQSAKDAAVDTALRSCKTAAMRWMRRRRSRSRSP
jgi:hypothetical protein